MMKFFFEIGNETRILIIITPGLNVLEILSTKKKKDITFRETIRIFKN